jgi:RNA-splicing ligase RtcB
MDGGRTVGSGNHYVDIFVNEADRVWVGVHFGSRGLGHKTATYFLQEAGGEDGMDVPPAVVRRDSDLGQAYMRHLLNATQLMEAHPGLLQLRYLQPIDQGVTAGKGHTLMVGLPQELTKVIQAREIK